MYEIGDAEIEAVRAVIEKRKLFRYQQSGPSECDLFEKEFANYLGEGVAVLVTSGTNALIAALRAAGVGQGDEVIIPCYTFVATALAVKSVGAIPVIVNINENLGISLEDAERRISERTKAIIPVHMDGLAANMDKTLELAKGRGLSVIEDACQGIGGSFRGKKLGMIGNFGCFSFNEKKNISAGEGGAVVSNDSKNGAALFLLQDASSRFSPCHRERLEASDAIGFSHLGYSMRASEITGAIMRAQLRRLDGILKALRERKAPFLKALEGVASPRVILGECAAGDCGSALHLLFDSSERANDCSRQLLKLGIAMVSPILRPAHVCWKWGGVVEDAKSPAKFLDSVEILSRVLKLDIDPTLTLEDTLELAMTLRRVIS